MTIFKDHLGSIDVSADGFGNVEQSMSFGAWGAAALVTYGGDITSRGYTVHEMLDGTKLTGTAFANKVLSHSLV